jgi:prepilin-type N-terminal cleavage/methylation domain-containing protein
MKNVESKKRDQGMSLVELMIGIGIFGAIMGLAVGLIGKLHKVSTGIRDDAASDQSFSGFSQRFVADVMNSDVGLHFINMPIRFSGCAANAPCVRQLDLNGRFTNVPSLPGVNSVQFFRDEHGTVEDLPAYRESDKLRIRLNRPISFPPEILSAQYYTTWPLTSDPTEPFVLMTRKADSSAYFTLLDAFGASSPAPAAGNSTIVESSTVNIDAKGVVGSLFVIFNSSEPKQYGFRIVDKLKSCKENLKECSSVANAINSKHNLDLSKGRYHLISFADVSADALKGFVPQKSVAISGGWWPPQSAQDYIFPYRSPTIRNTDSGAPSLDARALVHFYHAAGIRSARLIAIPVQMQAYYAEQSVAAKKKSLNIIRWDFYPRRKFVVLRDLPSTTQVWVARKLGTREIKIFKSQ